jgi:hypothetical protein
VERRDEKYLDMTMAELEILLGEHLIGSGLGSKRMSDEMKRRAGRNWFEQNLHKLRAAICQKDSLLMSMFARDKKDRNMIFARICDLVAASFHLFPAAVIAGMVLHYGIDRLCTSGKHAKRS